MSEGNSRLVKSTILLLICIFVLLWRFYKPLVFRSEVRIEEKEVDCVSMPLGGTMCYVVSARK